MGFCTRPQQKQHKNNRLLHKTNKIHNKNSRILDFAQDQQKNTKKTNGFCTKPTQRITKAVFVHNTSNKKNQKIAFCIKPTKTDNKNYGFLHNNNEQILKTNKLWHTTNKNP